jgi:hypothetical protein
MEPIKRFFGLALILLSLIGLLLSVAGLVLIPRVGRGVEARMTHTLDLAILTLEVTGESLTLANTSLDQSVDALGAAQSTTEGVGETLEDTGPLLDRLAMVVGGDLPEVITSTQKSLDSAQESALVIDRVLYGLDSISFLTSVEYDPEVPLSQSLADVADSLEGLPASFTVMQEDLETAQTNLEMVEIGISDLADSLADIETSLQEAKEVIAKYVGVVGSVETELEDMRQNLPRWIQISEWVVAFVLVWLAIIQIGLFFQGREMMGAEEAG